MKIKGVIEDLKVKKRVSTTSLLVSGQKPDTEETSKKKKKKRRENKQTKRMIIKIVKIYLELSLVLLWAVWGQFIFR